MSKRHSSKIRTKTDGRKRDPNGRCDLKKKNAKRREEATGCISSKVGGTQNLGDG